MYFENTRDIESVSVPPVMSVPAERGAIEMLSPRAFASATYLTTATTSSVSFGKTTAAGVRSKMLVSRLYCARNFTSSLTSPLISGASSSRRFIGELYQYKKHVKHS